MPTRKEWVVDETGFHAKSVWESAPAKKSAVYPDDTSCSAENKENHEVELVRGTWLEGKEGFQFNKKCIVQVKAEYLKKTNRRRQVPCTKNKEKTTKKRGMSLQSMPQPQQSFNPAANHINS